MNTQVLKTIVFGALIGAALFAAPFFVAKVLLFFLVIGLFFRIFRVRRHYRHGWRGPYGWAYADKIRGMSDEEFANFKERFGRGCWDEATVEGKDVEDQKDEKK
jgi:hypothetical protein